jgi:hypothetical protein
VGSEDGALKAEPQTIYAFPHNAWNLHIVENEMEHVDRNPRLYVVLDDDDLGHTNSTSTPGPGKRQGHHASTSVPGLRMSLYVYLDLRVFSVRRFHS